MSLPNRIWKWSLLYIYKFVYHIHSYLRIRMYVHVDVRISFTNVFIFVGLRSGRDKFLFYSMTMILVAYSTTAQVFAFSAMFKAYNVAYAVLLMIITITVVSVL